jgi:AraC-like DNA-binding protein
MYRPVKDGIEKKETSVSYTESLPPLHLRKFVNCFWELKVTDILADDFHYHIVPDACVNILFDQQNIKIAAITALQAEFRVLNLGKNFHYVGIQLLPGVWRGPQDEIVRGLVDKPYAGNLSLLDVNQRIFHLDLKLKESVLSLFVEELIAQRFIEEDPVLGQILSHIDTINNVSAMAKIAGLSPRQLQRRLTDSISLTPHDLLKVIRIQQAFRQHYLDFYSDQSHFIHSFRRIMGYTPKKYIKKFNV